MVKSERDKKFEIPEKGVRFECQGSGQCCLSRGEYGYVYMTLDDRKRMAEVLGLKTSVFTKSFCEKTDGMYHLKSDSEKEECVFLKDKKCAVYKGRPTQCRTWPFWPEVMNAKAWSEEVEGYCPGINKGRYYGPSEISDILNWQKRSTDKL